MPWLLDGNNLARGRDRDLVRRAALSVARRERVRIVVFFDGAPPPGGTNAEELGRVEVRYAPDADAAIVAFLRGRGRGWTVATDDRRLAGAAREAGAGVVPASGFWRKAGAAAPAGDRATGGTAAPGADLEFLSDVRNRLPAAPARVPRRTRRGPRKR